MFNFEILKYPVIWTQSAQKYFNNKQRKLDNINAYYKRLKMTIESLKYYKANISYCPTLKLHKFYDNGHP